MLIVLRIIKNSNVLKNKSLENRDFFKIYISRQVYFANLKSLKCNYLKMLFLNKCLENISVNLEVNLEIEYTVFSQFCWKKRMICALSQNVKYIPTCKTSFRFFKVCQILYVLHLPKNAFVHYTSLLKNITLSIYK